MSETGVVAMFMDRKGFGFIKPDKGGDDVYVHREDVRGGGLLDGDEVTFDRETNDRLGKDKAVNVTGGTGGDRWGKGPRKGGGKGSGSPGEKKGTVTRFYAGRGYGFIKPDDGGDELFVGQDDVYGGGLLDGDVVQYDETTNSRNGKSKAVNVSGGTGGSSWGKVGGGKGSKGGSKGGKSSTVIKTGCSGQVAMFMDQRGYGFIKPSDASGDVFVSRDDVSGGGLLDGDEVSYDLAEDDASGKTKAVNVRGGTGGDRWGRAKGDSKGKGKGKDK